MCRRCPRLVAWREFSAANPPKRFRGEKYWGRPIPAFGDRDARVLIVGLAPAANGGNRTGRMFTGDESGNFLFRALYEAGLASQPTSVHRNDGLTLHRTLISAAARCAPPGNRPLPQELDNCREYIRREFALLPPDLVMVALGGLAFATCLKILADAGVEIPKPRPRFAHGAQYRIGQRTLLATYHPSQQNTFTGKLTPAMLRAMLKRAARLAGVVLP